MVRVIRNGEFREFTENVWNRLPSHKYGWEITTEEPPEVTNLKTAARSKVIPKTNGLAENGKMDPKKSTVKTSADNKPAKVIDVVNQINAATTAAEVDAIAKGDKRVTVVNAAKARKAEFK